ECVGHYFYPFRFIFLENLVNYAANPTFPMVFGGVEFLFSDSAMNFKPRSLFPYPCIMTGNPSRTNGRCPREIIAEFF
ncbi:MAG: hypothetical protein ACLFTV_11645, partial [Desulfococcaceae bacterium]